MSILQTIAAFIVALGILVAIHEFGHFWVARRLGVKILRFSVGFGQPLFTRRLGADQTEFTIAAIPLGGYVKMLDHREGEVPAAEAERAFDRQPLAYRTAIVLAGPLANFLFAVAAYWAMFMTGVTGLQPLVGEVDANSLADRAGFRPGQEIVSVDGRSTPTWDALLHRAIAHVIDAREVSVGIIDVDGEQRELRLDFSAVNVDDISEGRFFAATGLYPMRPLIPAVIDSVEPGMPAAAAGMQAGDLILTSDGAAIRRWDDWVDYVRARPGRSIVVTLLRDGAEISAALVPGRVEDGGETVGRIGARVRIPDDLPPAPSAVERYGPIAAIGKALQKTADMTSMTLRILGKMLVGQASVKNLSGPVSIAQFAGQSASLGVAQFLGFLALVSVSLGVLNLLPIPLLDGGHLFFYLIEFAARRPVPESIQVLGQQIGLFVLLSLMGLAVYNDIMRII
ncbi:MAG: RIP metalloprotease RseP [Gammaproteobacteria bacterium]|nr:RIP metalloprotease RseP [Gammaproteobacteria bacterium]